MLIELSEIRRDGGTQPRAWTDQVTVEDYASAMERGKVFPACQVVFDGTDYWLIDGFHRIGAAERNGLAAFDCDVHQGTLDDAKWMSFAANAENSRQRSRDDLHRAIEAALRHPKGIGMADRAIASHVDCCHKTVGAMRKRLEVSGEVPRSETRTGVDGVTRTFPGVKSSPAPEPDPEIQAPEGGWPEPDEDGNYPTELAEPVFCNKGHAQAVIHVLQVEPLSWQNTPRWIANAAIVGVSGCELSMPLGRTVARGTREEAITRAAQMLAVHILRCLRDESLLASRHATLLHFLDWAWEQGTNRIDAEGELKREEQARDQVFVRIAVDVLFGILLLANETGRDAEAFQDWGRIVREMVNFADAGEVDGHDEMVMLIDQVDAVEARMAAFITAIREYKARQIAG